ncbi:MAG: hypothetical protein R3E39_29650 [Anaerolineae bacterium]
MRPIIVVILLCSLFALLPANAQEAPTPIIAVKDGSIYAFSPANDSAEPLLSAPDHYAEIAENNRKPVVLTSAEWLSPDGRYLAYRVIVPTNSAIAITPTSRFTQALFVLDLHDPKSSVSINLGTDETTIESVAWSLDNTRLYVLANHTLNILARDDWALQTSVDVGGPHPSQAPVISRRIFASDAGVVLVDATDGRQPIGINFTVFDADGGQVTAFQADWNSTPGTTFYSPFEPLEVDGIVQYGFVDNYNTLVYLGSFAPATVNAVEDFNRGYATIGMVSRNAPETSLQVTVFGYETTFDLSVRDAQGSWLADIPQLRAFAYGGYSGDHFGTRFALSPDGQTLAYLSDKGLAIWHEGESRTLDFTADVIIWSPPQYVTVDLPQ